jgi:arylsulfatase A-like enzyme
MRRESIREAALAGGAFGLLHASVECLFRSAVVHWANPPGNYDPSTPAFAIAWFVCLSAAWACIAVGIRAVRRWNAFTSVDSGHILLAASVIASLTALEGSQGIFLRSSAQNAVLFSAIALGSAVLNFLVLPSHTKLFSGLIFASSVAAFQLLSNGNRPAQNILAGAGYVAAILLTASAAGRTRMPGLALPFCLAALSLTGALWFDSDLRVSFARATGARTQASPNVLLITMDTVRADHTSLYGYARDTTPHLRAYANSATLYKNSYSASNWTLPSHYSIFTGLYPAEHGGRCSASAPGIFPESSGNPKFLAELLGQQGYVTMATVANNVMLETTSKLAHGFQYYRSFHPKNDGGSPLPFSFRALVLRMDRLLFPSRHQYDAFGIASEVTGTAERLLDAVAVSRRPFLLFVNYMDAHAPYNPPPPYDTAFGDSGPWIPGIFVTKEFLKVRSGKGQIDPQTRQNFINRYDGGIKFEDEQIYQLLRHLKSLGLDDNTIVIITSDHGEAFGEHTTVEHSASLYQDQIAVPLIVKFPGQKIGEVVEHPVSGVDLFPTILNAAELPKPKGIAGADLKLVDRPTPVVAEMSQCYSKDQIPRRFEGEKFAIMEGSWKFILTASGRREMYSLPSDPMEIHDKSREFDEIRRGLETKMSRYFTSITRPAGKSAKISKEHHERLKSLGYAQ